MNLEEIKEMIEYLEGRNLNEVSLEVSGVKLKVKKNADGIGGAVSMPMQTINSPVTEIAGEEVKSVEVSEEELVRSPIVGTFYAASSPDNPPFVKVGDKVKKGDTVCIVEAMKLMNEIVADNDCIIEEILVKNEQMVEYNHPIMKVKCL